MLNKITDMKHALIITAYKNQRQLNLLIDSSPFDCYIHLDRKCDLNTDLVSSKAKYVIKKYKIYWGSINHLYAILDLLKEASKTTYDYYHIISGEDAWACNIEMVDAIVGCNHNIYLDCFKLPRIGWWGGGYPIFQLRTISAYCDIRYGVPRILNKAVMFIQKILPLKLDLPKLPLFGGSVYCSLTHNAVEYVLCNSLSANLLKRLRYSTCGEEVYFQTILMNSDLKDKVITNNLRYIDWSTTPAPKFLTLSDVTSQMEWNCNLFCRKIASAEVLYYLLDKATK